MLDETSQTKTTGQEERRYTPSERVARLREAAMQREPDSFLHWHRSYYFLEGWMEADGQPLPMRHAAGFARFLENVPVRLFPNELLVGDHGNGGDICNLRAVNSRSI